MAAPAYWIKWVMCPPEEGQRDILFANICKDADTKPRSPKYPPIFQWRLALEADQYRELSGALDLGLRHLLQSLCEHAFIAGVKYGRNKKPKKREDYRISQPAKKRK